MKNVLRLDPGKALAFMRHAFLVITGGAILANILLVHFSSDQRLLALALFIIALYLEKIGSRKILILALVLLGVTALFLCFEARDEAERSAVWAFFLLVTGLIAHSLERREGAARLAP